MLGRWARPRLRAADGSGAAAAWSWPRCRWIVAAPGARRGAPSYAAQLRHELALELFAAHDRDGSGTLEPAELRRLAEQLGGLDLGEGEAEEALVTMDTRFGDGSRSVGADEFAAWWSAQAPTADPSRPNSLLEQTYLRDAVDGLLTGLDIGVGKSGRRSRLQVLTNTLLERQQQALALFQRVDADGSGELDRAELSLMTRKVGGFEMSEAEIEAALEQMDADGSGTISAPEFVSWWALEGLATASRQREAGELFDRFDVDGSGQLDLAEVSVVAYGEQRAGGRLKLAKKEVEEMRQVLSEVDADGSGTISRREFVAWRVERQVAKDKTAESAAAFLADEGTRAAVAVVGESAAERVFNKHDPWAGLPDFIGFTPRLCAAAVDASLCAAIAVRVALAPAHRSTRF